VHGSWDVMNAQGELERVRPEDIRTTAHLTIEGELDDISGSGQTAAAHGLCNNVPKARQKHIEVKGAGHYGIFSGRRWRELVYPQVRDFIKQFNEPAKPEAKTASRKVAAARRTSGAARASTPARARRP
jgi:poly(3-hydroxybutyrate) depolymerase